MPASAIDDSNKPLRVLMTADAVGGVWRYSVDLAAALVDDGAEVLIATMGPRPTEEQRNEFLTFPRVRLVESDYALEWMADSWDDVEASGNWLLRLQSSFDPDVIHLNGYAHATLRWNKPVAVVAHSCVYSWWRAVHGCAPGPDWSEYKRRVADGLSAADVVIAPSAYVAGELEGEYGVSPDKVRVIHNFSHAHVSPHTKKQPFVLAAGRIWDDAKNIALLQRIAPELEWEVGIAGDAESPEASTRKGQSACFLGLLPHPELMRQMSLAGIFAHPALYEPFGLSVLEAARARCCLVLSNIPSLRELWDGAAIFIDPREPEVWVREINRLARDSSERESLGQLAYSQSMKYRPSSSLKQYRDVYAALVSSNTGVAA
jgi:glycosyltransferase involved in cell wall biosynthesis